MTTKYNIIVLVANAYVQLVTSTTNSLFGRNGGLLEIFSNGTWSGVCSQDMDENVADPFCRYLGYSSGISVPPDVYQAGDDGSGSGMALQQVRCPPGALSLTECQIYPPAQGDAGCQLEQQLALECNTTFGRLQGLGSFFVCVFCL